MTNTDRPLLRTRAELMNALYHFVHTNGEDTPDGYGRIGYRPGRGLVAIVRGLAEWFEQATWIVDDEHGRISPFLHFYLVEAFEDFRTKEQWALLRAAYTDQSRMGYEIPDLTDPAGGYSWTFLTRDLERLLPILLGEGPWLERELALHFRAKQEVIDIAWRRFVRVCLRPMAMRLKKESHRGNKGAFGDTLLMSYAMAGRVMFTLERPCKGRALDRYQITFIHDDSDMAGLRSGNNFTDTPWQICCNMIDDVVDHWDESKFVEDGKVTMDAIAAMQSQSDT